MVNLELNQHEVKTLIETLSKKLKRKGIIKEIDNWKSHAGFYDPIALHINSRIVGNAILHQKLKEIVENSNKKILRNEYITANQLLRLFTTKLEDIDEIGLKLKKIFVNALYLYAYEKNYSDYNNQRPEIHTDKNLNSQSTFLEHLKAFITLNAKNESAIANQKNWPKVRILETFIENFPQFLKALENLCENFPNCQIQILLVNPSSKITDYRKEALKLKGSQIDRNLDEIAKWIKKNGYSKQVEVRLFDDIPGFSLYTVEDNLCMGWFWNHQPVLEGPFIEFYIDHPLANQVIEHFNTLWKRSKEGVVDFWNIDKRLRQLKEIPVLVSPQSIQSEFDQNANLVHFECFFWRNGEVDSIYLSCDLNTNYVLISQTSSRDTFRGDILTIGKENIITLETDQSARKRVVFLILNKSFYDEDLSIGLLTNIQPSDEKGIATTGHVIFKKIESLPEIKEKTEVPSAIYLYLKDSEISLEEEIQKINTYEKLKEKMDRKRIPENLIGDYSFYCLHGKNGHLYKSALRIDEEGKIWFKRREGVAQYYGALEMFNTRYVLIRNNTQENSSPFYYILLKWGKEKLKGLYVGLEGVINGGRIYLLKEQDDYFKRGDVKAEFVDWQSEAAAKVLDKIPDLRNFFEGGLNSEIPLGDFFLDNSVDLPLAPNLMKMPPGQHLYGQLGVYSYYYKSADPRKGFRRVIFSINKDGIVKVKSKKQGPFILEGNALRYDNLLHIFLFRKSGNSIRRYVGALILYCKQEAENLLMLGIIGMLSDIGMPVGRRVLMIKENTHNEDLDTVYNNLEPELFDLKDLNDQSNNLQSLIDDFFNQDKIAHIINPHIDYNNLYNKYFGHGER